MPPRNKIYGTDIAGGTGAIRRANLDGTNVQVLVTGLSFSFLWDLELDVTKGKIYWTEAGGNRIRRANLVTISAEG